MPTTDYIQTQLEHPEIEVLNLRKCRDWGKPGDVKIDRTTKWGNPYHMNADTEKERAIVIAKYEHYFKEFLLDDIDELKDAKRLGCWCKPKACHGDVITKYIEKYL